MLKKIIICCLAIFAITLVMSCGNAQEINPDDSAAASSAQPVAQIKSAPENVTEITVTELVFLHAASKKGDQTARAKYQSLLGTKVRVSGTFLNMRGTGYHQLMGYKREFSEPPNSSTSVGTGVIALMSSGTIDNPDIGNALSAIPTNSEITVEGIYGEPTSSIFWPIVKVTKIVKKSDP